MQIPLEFEPHPNQLPAYVRTEADLARFRVCFAIGRVVTARDCDVLFVSELYHSDMPTDDKQNPSGGQLELR